MTRFHKALVQCPFCASDEEVVIWDLIDVGEDPDLRERLLTKGCQVLYCQNCGEESILAEPLTYVDPRRRLVIAWRPELEEVPGAAEGQDAPDAEEALLNLPPGLDLDQLPRIDALVAAADEQGRGPWRLRLVATYNDLLEAIHCFDAGLDDRVLEVVKLALRTRYADEENIRFEAMHFLALGEGVLLFQVLEAEQGWHSLEIHAELYDNAYDMLVDRLPAESQWQRIDEAFALRFIEAMGAA